MFHPAVTPMEPGPPEILYVGRFDPYKELVTLVEAFAQLRNAGLRARLRVIGPPDDRYPEPHERARALGLDDVISWSGYLSDEELRAAYQRASVFVLPSSYEGFGLPVLEAMACGTPVVCSNATSLPEVAGDAALLVEPGRAEPLAEAIRRVLTDQTLAEDLRKRGLHQARAFTWKRAAQETVEVYRRADAL
jgi:glycosyltransferase involved in cell wall biosynthesis